MSTNGESLGKQLVAPLGRWGCYMCPSGESSREGLLLLWADGDAMFVPQP